MRRRGRRATPAMRVGWRTIMMLEIKTVSCGFYLDIWLSVGAVVWKNSSPLKQSLVLYLVFDIRQLCKAQPCIKTKKSKLQSTTRAQKNTGTLGTSRGPHMSISDSNLNDSENGIWIIKKVESAWTRILPGKPQIPLLCWRGGMSCVRTLLKGNELAHISSVFSSWIRSVGWSCLLCVFCGWKILLGCVCRIQDHSESFPFQNDGVIHTQASVKLDTIFIVIESKWRHHTNFVHPKHCFFLLNSASLLSSLARIIVTLQQKVAWKNSATVAIVRQPHP